MKTMMSGSQRYVLSFFSLVVQLSGCAYKAGPFLPSDATLTRGHAIACEINTPRVADSMVNFAAGFTYAWHFGLDEDAIVTTRFVLPGPYVDEVDFRIGARLFPLKNQAVVDPYVGYDLGYYRINRTEAIVGPSIGGGWYLLGQEHKEVSGGFSLSLLSGIKFPISKDRTDLLLLELRYDLPREARNINFAGTYLMIGVELGRNTLRR